MLFRKAKSATSNEEDAAVRGKGDWSQLLFSYCTHAHSLLVLSRWLQRRTIC